MITFDFKKYQYKKLEDYDLSEIKERFLKDKHMSGWYDLDKSCVDSIESTASYIRNNCDVFLVIGIGGSYMGAKAVIDALSPYYGTKKPEVLFAGYQLSSDYMADLIDYLQDKEVMVNVISKSGTTLEPAIAFDMILDFMENKYGEEECAKRVFVTTDANSGELLPLANQKGFQRFVVPDNIGGRFSVLTPVGLLPIAVAGFSIEELFKGATEAKENLEDCYYYTKLRHELYNMNKTIESFDIYEPKLASFSEWLKQLFGETEGKNELGIFPTSTLFTRDLHSIGQFIQEGNKILFETVINIKNSKNYIEYQGINLNSFNNIIVNSVIKAHHKGNTPCLEIEMDELTLENLATLIYFFELSAAFSGFLFDVDPFNQPGVEIYKQEIKKSLNEEF